MSGHSKWTQIKHQKGVTDQKRGKLFSKLLAAITAAAKSEPNPEFNPRLRSAVQKAKENQMPAENIERAIKRASEAGGALDELLLEAYGPGGSAILIEAITDNKNRTIPEIKKILSDNNAKWAESGSVQWAFESSADESPTKFLVGDERGLRADSRRWTPKFQQEISGADKENLEKLVEELENHDDVQKVYTNVKS